MAAFPSTLPAPLASSYTVEPGSAIQRTDFDVGPARQRKRFTSVPEIINVMWRFNAAQMLIFRVFYKTTVNEGVDFFDALLNVGDGEASYNARFTEPYKAVKSSFFTWDVSAKLEIENA